LDADAKTSFAGLRRLLVIFFALIITLSLLALFSLDSSIGKHPQFGGIYQTSASDLNLARSNPVGQFLRKHLPPKILASRYFSARLRDQPKYLELADSQIEWSIGGAKTGWLYFWDVDRKARGWEFAPCAETNLLHLTPTALPKQFYGASDPAIPKVFDSSSSTNAIKVTQGDILFARRAHQTNRIYLLKLENQEGDRLFVQYCIAAEK